MSKTIITVDDAATMRKMISFTLKGAGHEVLEAADGVEALKTLLDLMCVEVQLTNQLGHNRPQEGSEQFFAYAIENKTASGYGVPYADLVGPGILIAASLHGQNVNQIRDTIDSAGVRLDQLRTGDIRETMRNLPEYVKKHNLPYSIWNEFEPTDERLNQILSQTGLDARMA